MTKDTYSFVAKRIRLERKKLGLTIEQLAHSAGITYSFLACIETNKSKPSVETVYKIADALGIEVFKLFKDVPVQEIPENEKIKRQINLIVNSAKPKHRKIMMSTLKELSKILRKNKKIIFKTIAE